MADSGFNTPTLAELITRISDDLNARMTGEDSRLRRSFLYVVARVWAGAAYLMHQHIAYAAANLLPDRSTGAILRRWIEVYGVEVPVAAKATGNVTITLSSNTTIPANTVFTDADGELLFYSDSSVNATTPTHAIPVTAAEVGSAHNVTTGTKLYLQSPIANVTTEGSAAANFTGGVDAPDDDDLRDTLLSWIRERPQGGAKADYVQWAKAASSSLGSVWVAPTDATDPSTVQLYVSAEYDGSDPASVIPSGSGITSAVSDYILDTDANGDTYRIPVGASLNVSNVTGNAVDIEVTLGAGLVGSDYEDDITDALAALFQRRMQPVGTTAERTVLNSEIRSAIGAVIDKFTLDDVDGDGTGTSNVVQSVGQVAYLGTLTVNDGP